MDWPAGWQDAPVNLHQPVDMHQESGPEVFP